MNSYVKELRERRWPLLKQIKEMQKKLTNIQPQCSIMKYVNQTNGFVKPQRKFDVHLDNNFDWHVDKGIASNAWN